MFLLVELLIVLGAKNAPRAEASRSDFGGSCVIRLGSLPLLPAPPRSFRANSLPTGQNWPPARVRTGGLGGGPPTVAERTAAFGLFTEWTHRHGPPAEPSPDRRQDSPRQRPEMAAGRVLGLGALHTPYGRSRTGSPLPPEPGQIAPQRAAGEAKAAGRGIDSPRPAGRAGGLPSPRHAYSRFRIGPPDRFRAIG
jgi:hypothetical protein